MFKIHDGIPFDISIFSLVRWLISVFYSSLTTGEKYFRWQRLIVLGEIGVLNYVLVFTFVPNIIIYSFWTDNMALKEWKTRKRWCRKRCTLNKNFGLSNHHDFHQTWFYLKHFVLFKGKDHGLLVWSTTCVGIIIGKTKLGENISLFSYNEAPFY